MTIENSITNFNPIEKCILNDLIPLSKFGEYFKYPSVGAIRQYIFYEDKYNFKNVYKRIGNRIYISITAFNDWVQQQN